MNRESQIFNRMLGIAGLAFSEGIEIDHPFAPAAKNLITTVRRQLALGDNRTQRMGWWFNTEPMTILLSMNEAIVPDDVLRLDVVGSSQHLDVIRRGDRLWNRAAQSFDFPDEDQIECIVTLDLPLDETPEAFQAAVEAECCRRFAVSPLNAVGQAQAFAEEFAVAIQQLVQEDDAQKPANVLTDGDHDLTLFARGCRHARRCR